jgi:hypothetical protein
MKGGVGSQGNTGSAGFGTQMAMVVGMGNYVVLSDAYPALGTPMPGRMRTINILLKYFQ